MGGPRCRFGNSGEENLPVLGIESRVSSHPFYSLTAIPTEIFRLHIDVKCDIKLINAQLFKMRYGYKMYVLAKEPRNHSKI